MIDDRWLMTVIRKQKHYNLVEHQSSYNDQQFKMPLQVVNKIHGQNVW